MPLLKKDSGRTEKPTGKRRAESRGKGQIPRSRTLPAAAVLLGMIGILGANAGWMLQDLSQMTSGLLRAALPREYSGVGLQSLLLGGALEVSQIAMVVTMTAMILSVAANAAQGGLVASTHKLKPKMSNLSPLNGIKRMFSNSSLFELAKSLATVAILAHLGHSLYLEVVEELPRYVLLPPLLIAERVGALVFRFGIQSGVYLLIIGVFDYFWQRHKMEESMKMTKQEVKDEAKNAEGNPEIKGRIRKKQREVALRRMMADVPKADVVITNPTHYAVALMYRREKMTAPTVVAKGQGFVALRIREIAEESRVPCVENPALAQLLYKMVEVGSEIPEKLFKTVAEVLAYVYKLKQMRL